MGLKEFKNYPIEKLVSADWNYKEDDDNKKEKLKANIKRNGQIENIIIRELKTGFFEVVNGNHRLIAMKELKQKNIVCYNLGKISDAQARRIAVETNETKFSSDEIKLANLIKELSEEFPVDELIETMPFSKEEIEDMVGLSDFDFDGLESGKFTAPEESGFISVADFFGKFDISGIPNDLAVKLESIIEKTIEDNELNSKNSFMIFDIMFSNWLNENGK